jgi:hypothetical protein
VNRAWLPWGICGLVVLMLVGPVRGSDWSLPNLNPFSSTTPKRSNQPSTWSKMSRNTKTFFSRTYDALTPWDTDAEKARAQKASRNSGKSNNQSKSPFSSLWSAEEEPKKPQTVSDWLKQPRP